MAENERMRTTLHNGRKGKDGVYNPKHNDRNGYEAEHIDKSLTPENTVWLCDNGTGTIEEHEQKMYEKLFAASLDAKNDSYKKHGNHKCIREMKEYRTAPQSCPEETIIEIGNTDNCKVPPAELLEMYQELLEWQGKTYPKCKVLDYALHLDEPNSAPHIHERKVWVADRYNKDGTVRDQVVGQAKALAQMGVERPHPEKKSGRFNNAKQIFTRAMRDKFNQICKEHGYDIEVTPKEPSKTGLSLLEYQRRQEEEKLKKAQRTLETCERNIATKEEGLKEAAKDYDAAYERAEIAEERAEKAEKKAGKAEKRLEKMQNEIDNLTPTLDDLKKRNNRILGKKITLTPAEYEFFQQYVFDQQTLDVREKELNERDISITTREKELDMNIRYFNGQQIKAQARESQYAEQHKGYEEYVAAYYPEAKKMPAYQYIDPKHIIPEEEDEEENSGLQL